MPYINLNSAFWPHYRSQPGHLRREALLGLFKQNPTAQLPVNGKWQASSHDPDLAELLKRGVLEQFRDGGRARHHQNKTSRKRQSYLVLAKAHGGKREEARLAATPVLKVQMHSALDSAGWVSRLSRASLRIGCRMGTFGRTHWFLQSGEDAVEVVQMPSRAYTTTLEAPTEGQLRIVEQLFSVGAASTVSDSTMKR